MQHTSRYSLPRNWHVRYDVHDHPRGVSAVVLDSSRNIKAVGFAKFNPRDENFSINTGESIALGRALSKIPHLTRRDLVAQDDPPFRMHDKHPKFWTEEELQNFVLRDMRPLTNDVTRSTSYNDNARERSDRRDPSRSIADELF